MSCGKSYGCYLFVILNLQQEVLSDKVNIGCVIRRVTQCVDQTRKLVRTTWSYRCVNRKAVREIFLIRNNFGIECRGSFMSIQVLSVLVSARLSGLVYKVLIEHEVCTVQSIIFEFEFLLSAHSVSPPPYPSLRFLCFTELSYTPELCTLCLRTRFRTTYSFTK